MTMKLLLLFLALSVALPCTRQRILDCVAQRVDTNGNGFTTVAEWRNFFIHSNCALFLPPVAPSSIVSTCDRNGDSMLSAADYDSPTSCMNSDTLRTSICEWCDRCDAQ